MRLPSITVASPPSGLRCCHNLGGRGRWQSSTDRWLGVLAIVVWRTILLYKDNCKAHCPIAGMACMLRWKELSWDVSNNDRWIAFVQERQSRKKNKCSEIFLAVTTIESELDDASRHQSSVGNVSGLAFCQVWEAESGHCGEPSKRLRSSGWENSMWTLWEEEFVMLWKHYSAGKWMSAVFSRQSRARIPGTSTDGVLVFVAEEWIEKKWSLRQNHLSEAYSRLVCGYLSVCVCSTEWSKWWG